MCRFAAICLILFAASPAHSQQAFLMTYGTAERVEEQFGHNAIWIRDPERGVDAVYNFGFFDFDKPGFYREFLFGEMIYFALARDPEVELSYYRWRDRSIRAQLLNLSPETVRRLTGWLDRRVAPENRDFAYDYYLYNCSTRVRDALDFALAGALREATVDQPARLDFRAHTRRMVQDDPLLYVGIEAGLGRPADRPRDRWEEMFLPEVVAETVGDMTVAASAGGREPLVLADRVLYQSTRPPDPERPAFPWMLFGGLAVLSTALIAAPSALFRRRVLALTGARLWIAFVTAGGLLLAFLWLATDHQAAWRNENLLLFNPLAALLWRFRGGRLERIAAAMVGTGLVLAVLLKFLPGAQWNRDLLLWLLPAQAALLAVWKRKTVN